MVFALLPPARKEALEQANAFVFQHAGCHLERVVQPRVGMYLIQRAKRPGFRVGRSVDAASDARLVHEPGAHDARLERYVHRAIGQAPCIEFFGGKLYGRELGMARRVL